MPANGFPRQPGEPAPCPENRQNAWFATGTPAPPQVVGAIQDRLPRLLDRMGGDAHQPPRSHQPPRVVNRQFLLSHVDPVRLGQYRQIGPVINDKTRLAGSRYPVQPPGAVEQLPVVETLVAKLQQVDLCFDERGHQSLECLAARAAVNQHVQPGVGQSPHRLLRRREGFLERIRLIPQAFQNSRR